MIASAPGSAQSASSLLCASESEIKTIVKRGSALVRVTVKVLAGAEPSPFQNPDWKRISNRRHVSYFHRHPLAG